MPLEPVKLDSPVNLRKILDNSKVPLQDSQGQPLTVDALFQATPTTDKAKQSTEEATVPLETERIIGLYFSASWCPPCRNFTPQLACTYSELKKQNRDFEVVFCSWDNKPEEYLHYAQSMPWARLPFRDPRIQELSKAFNVKGIPCLVMVRANDNGLITKDARMAVPYDPLGKKYPWNVQSSNWLLTLWNGLPITGKFGFAGLACYGAYKLAMPRVMKR